jgi:hypothetical protein
MWAMPNICVLNLSVCPIHMLFSHLSFVGFEVLIAVVTKSSVFWDITSCSPLKVNRCFGATCRRHLHGRRISEARNQREAVSKQSSTWLIPRPWRWRWHVPPKRRLTFNGLHGVIPQKIRLLMCVLFSLSFWQFQNRTSLSSETACCDEIKLLNPLKTEFLLNTI